MATRPCVAMVRQSLTGFHGKPPDYDFPAGLRAKG